LRLPYIGALDQPSGTGKTGNWRSAMGDFDMRFEPIMKMALIIAAMIVGSIVLYHIFGPIHMMSE
jgi:hypothetical protein